MKTFSVWVLSLLLLGVAPFGKNTKRSPFEGAVLGLSELGDKGPEIDPDGKGGLLKKGPEIDPNGGK